jgi:hypothetical protein
VCRKERIWNVVQLRRLLHYERVSRERRCWNDAGRIGVVETRGWECRCEAQKGKAWLGTAEAIFATKDPAGSGRESDTKRHTGTV